jgi:SAM-dependent methyltransferase
MLADAMEPHGLALRAYLQGDTDAQLLIRRDDGLENPLPVSVAFRSPDEFSRIEKEALDHCRGHVLDIGAGTGIHALVLESRGITVTAIDVNPHAVDVMHARGVRDAQQVDVFHYHGGPYDTLLMLGHGIGMVEDLAGLERFLKHAHELTRPGGQLLVHSVDVRRTADPRHLAYHEKNRRAGQYIGSIRLQLEFEGKAGPHCRWLHVDPETLEQGAGVDGWACRVVHEEESGEYLARLTRGA